ncbi:Alginate lyase [Mariniphaga anaerophila]|uniref:Alginate lyase n=2 Tax=Mariniphaga anaerophila TaxID=1484053 RepID=A0A1M4ZS01_9BACT|nr:Alginate lyase [Mariniphaga anaerophila]
MLCNCGNSQAPAEAQKIDGVFVDFCEIEKVKEHLAKNDACFEAAYNELIEKAQIAVTDNEELSVVHKKKVPASGDKHDYYSMGPYWWPDPSKADGLPYIRRDGEINPETRGDNVDTGMKSKFMANVESLTWAFYFTGDDKYADKAVELLETWFVNIATKMNPNLDYAQAIPGICEGRGIGIIDFHYIDKLISPIQILEGRNKFDAETKMAIHEWFEQYLEWLISSKNGIDEANTKNNHATWYDVQVAGIALFLDKTEMAKTVLEEVKSRRIANQIEPDGSQPLEIARTRSLSYSGMNTRGFIYLANMAQNVGVDLWNFETPDGRGIQKAMDYLLPYFAGDESWTHQQISNIDDAIGVLKLNYLIGAVKTGEEKYVNAFRSVAEPSTDLEVLLYPLFL